jgi:hypothetical protein
LDRALSIAAGVAAVTAVAVALYQTALSREQQRASAWPYVTQANSFVPGAPYRRLVSNEGVGPARIRQFQILVDGRAVASWEEAVRTLAGESEPALVYSTFGRGSVVPAGAERTLVSVPAGPRAGAVWTAAQTRLMTIVCYCSVYDECWRADSRTDEPHRVEACDVEPDGR